MSLVTYICPRTRVYVMCPLHHVQSYYIDTIHTTIHQENPKNS
jgi:hypothetical protein